ncbi:hydrogen peroxide-inducible genes activator [Aurantimonas sp. 22II-16-19i]|uniref:hydrogen peroxide-inducible genes activator n=1 Tax=Aurantimonas sp. 22II-16-19i TaxID=1317114 RepID=UPI0009F7A5DF|nr:hydrogen peroxide-inducible genes activator [Aurantimonas sp. 22II-16-19i]ORE97302.1 transcriptional regulator [Aurantimonas sp. 22II-16-19i]
MSRKLPSLRQLQCLLEISRTLHFGQAAQRCGMAQPSLSAQLQALEAGLGIRLVERGRSGVVLTAPGRRIAAHAATVMEEIRAMTQFAEICQDGVVGTIHLGAKPTLGPYILPQVVAHLHRDHASLRLYIRDAMPLELERELREGKHDVILAQLPVSGDDLVVRRLFRERLYVAVAADDPFAGRASIDPEELRGRPVLGMRSGFHLHDKIRALCDEHGARFLSEYEGTSLDALRQMVGMGMGLTFLPALYVQSEVTGRSDVVVVPLAGRPITRSIGLVWRERSGQVQVFEKFAAVMREIAGKGCPGITLE